MAQTENKLIRLIRPEVRALRAYHVPPAQGLIKLDAMENPYSWPEDMMRAWLEILSHVEINRYPDPAAQALRTRLRKTWNVPDGIELMLGNGSDELIQLILMSCALPGATVLAPASSFVMYSMISTFVGMKFVPVPLTESFALDVDAMHKAVAEHKPAVVFLSYPNNPTGNLFDDEDVEEVIAETDAFVVVDEAYHPFCQRSFMDRLNRYENLLVLRTFSKLGLAGLRLGVLVGAAPWLHEFDKVRLPYNINSLTQASVDFALDHAQTLEAQAVQIRRDRELLYEALVAMPGVRPWPSAANFILFRTEERAAREVFEHLKQRQVLIKNLDTPGGPLQGCLRVTVGTPRENEAFLVALEKSL